jgi:transcriptional regulator with XRE-family HTH domain
MEPVAAVFGRRIKTLREARGWTQEQLAKEAGLGPKHIGVIERGEKTSSFDAVEKLARALGVQYYDLFIPHARRTKAIDDELTHLITDANRIEPSRIEEFLKQLRAAVRKLDKYET